MEELKMEDFLRKLAQSKFSYKNKIDDGSQDLSSVRCFERIILQTRFDEIARIIHSLPDSEQKIVEKIYDKMCDNK
jgi:hypothetical protein